MGKISCFKKVRVSKIAQNIGAFAAKFGDLCSISGNNMMEEDIDSIRLYSDLHEHTTTYIYSVMNMGK